MSVVALLALGASAHAATPTISADLTEYRPWETVVVSWSETTQDPSDWIALADVGADPLDYHVWLYAGGVRQGAIAFRDPPVGNLVARFFRAGAVTPIAQSEPFQVGFADGSAPGVWIIPGNRAVGDVISVNFAHLSGDPDDWVTVVPTDAAPEEFGPWAYTNGAHDGVIDLTLGFTPGTYEVRLLPDNGFEVKAKSAAFEVL